MRRLLLTYAAAILLAGWLIYPYFTIGNTRDSSSTRPSLIEANHPSPFRQIHGQAGYWRLAEDQTGVWWWVSPAGKLEFLNTVTTVQPSLDGRERNSARYVSQDWDGKYQPTDLNRWADKTLARVLDSGFKGLGAWCNPAFHSLDVPMSQDLNLWEWVTDSSRRFYSPNWATMAEQGVKAQVPALRTNRNLLGYFLDNELDWGDGFSGPGAYFDDLPNESPNRRQVIETIHFVWPQLDDFNTAWNSKLTDWSQLETWPALPREQASAYGRLSIAWQSKLARDYFRLTTDLVRRYDPNHLILGVRFKGFAPEQVVAASRNYTDAQSLNYYVGDAHLDSDMFRMMYQKSGQPIIISEYSFHSMDGHSGNLNTVGFSAQVPDQQARADGYRLMTTRLARIPYIVGADWFQWCDEPPAGRSSDGEDVNFGIVDIHDKPYPLLVDAVKKTEPLLNPLHASSAEDSQADIWRESYKTKPSMHVPYLVHPPILDGDLTHWSPAAELDGIHREQTVGLERANLRCPDAFLGWTEQGLYMAFQVFDRHIETAPATAWWWTRDNIEIFLSTQPVRNDQSNYDVYCHQFFVVPADASAGNVPIVGQWHRDGDALKDNLIPAPGIQKVVKILPDRYVVELFIPSSSMHGYNPSHQSKLAFNLHVRDFSTAADFFWSAPKSSRTELRPNTWGTLYLDTPPTTNAVARTAQARIN